MTGYHTESPVLAIGHQTDSPFLGLVLFAVAVWLVWAALTGRLRDDDI